METSQTIYLTSTSKTIAAKMENDIKKQHLEKYVRSESRRGELHAEFFLFFSLFRVCLLEFVHG